MAELTPEQRAAWAAGKLDVDAYNKNPNQLQEKLENNDLVPYGHTKIGPNHPYYEKAKKEWEEFKEAEREFLAIPILSSPTTSDDFRKLDLKLREIQIKAKPVLDEYISEDHRNFFESIIEEYSLMYFFDITKPTFGHDSTDWLVAGEHMEHLQPDELDEQIRIESLEQALQQYIPAREFIKVLSKARELELPMASECAYEYIQCKRAFMSGYFERFGLDTPIEEVFNYYSSNIFGHWMHGLSAEATTKWDAWSRQFFEARQRRAEWVITMCNSFIDIGISRGEEELHEEFEEENSSEYLDYGFVYMIRNGDLVKIGITGNLLRRLAQLQPDEVLNVVRCSNFQDLEKDLHNLFKQERVPQTEYFRLTEHQIDKVHKLMTTLAEF
ncbi:bacteriophage-like DNA-binding domain-containing protein [Synechococcus sp. A15-127]|uniref:GIY-YIG nuclease family protein n=1 Tax=Synechococcus sp. A15-127 TaxID=1050624 RepID=UPI0016468538|nr:GIY-YIG nuclease family protein [Synechococcus sp. A15-127]QNI94551.1 bacteriophage-like DNA-binding domain-containing protein [Synechococcus sp. A15-127]